jgi:hypothetical protein
VHGRPVRRRGHHQRDLASQRHGDQRQDAGGVAADHPGPPGGALGVGVFDVGVGDVAPLALVLDADGVPAGVDRLDQGGADPAHGIQHEIAAGGVGAHGVGGDRRQHPGRMLDRLGHVPAATLDRAGRLRGRPHRQAVGAGHRGQVPDRAGACSGRAAGAPLGLVGLGRRDGGGALSHGDHYPRAWSAAAATPDGVAGRGPAGPRARAGGRLATAGRWRRRG